MARQHWLIKSEPQSYGIDALKADKKTAWTGVRNFQARNFMREMQVGDLILFYHSSCAQPGVYGIAKAASKPYPDPTQFDGKGHYFERRATKDKPVWDLVDISFVKKLKRPVLLTEIRATSKLHSMMLLQPGSRLSITAVSPAEFDEIMILSEKT